MLVAVASFAVAAVLIILLPGPDTLVVVRSILRGGRARGVAVACRRGRTTAATGR